MDALGGLFTLKGNQMSGTLSINELEHDFLGRLSAGISLDLDELETNLRVELRERDAKPFTQDGHPILAVNLRLYGKNLPTGGLWLLSGIVHFDSNTEPPNFEVERVNQLQSTNCSSTSRSTGSW